MASRLLPRPFQARLTTTTTRALSARSARAARLRRRQPSTTTTSAPSPSSSELPPHPIIPNTNTYPATASPRSSLLDPTDPLNLFQPQRQRRDQPAIHFFEQDVSQIGEAPPQPVNLARMEADEARAAELRRKIARLESEIDQIENSDEAELDATLMRLRAVYNNDDDGDAVIDIGGGGRAKAEGEGEGEEGEKVVELLGDAEPEQVRAELEALRIAGGIGSGGDKRTTKESVGRLNNCLRHAYLATDPQARPVIRQELWKAYKRAKMHVGPGLLERIPPPAWDLLFYSQAVRWKSNEKRDEHVRELLADMKSVGMDGPPTSPPDGKPLEVVD